MVEDAIVVVYLVFLMLLVLGGVDSRERTAREIRPSFARVEARCPCLSSNTSCEKT